MSTSGPNEVFDHVSVASRPGGVTLTRVSERWARVAFGAASVDFEFYDLAGDDPIDRGEEHLAVAVMRLGFMLEGVAGELDRWARDLRS